MVEFPPKPVAWAVHVFRTLSMSAQAASATEMTSLNGESKTTYSSDMQDSKVFTTVDERLQWEQHCKVRLIHGRLLCLALLSFNFHPHGPVLMLFLPQDRIAYYEADEAQSFPCFKLCLLAFVWAGVNVLDLFRGGGSYKGDFHVVSAPVGGQSIHNGMPLHRPDRLLSPMLAACRSLRHQLWRYWLLGVHLPLHSFHCGCGLLRRMLPHEGDSRKG